MIQQLGLLLRLDSLVVAIFTVFFTSARSAKTRNDAKRDVNRQGRAPVFLAVLAAIAMLAGCTSLKYPSDSILASTAPIALPASASVTDGGGAAYSIPLRVPDGAGGLQPRLSLEYGGHAGGRLGVGWTLAGLSSIAPCHRTYASEGNAAGIDFAGSDAYCMDGQKLVGPTKDGDAPRPIPDDTDEKHMVFYTEQQTFHRIVAHYATSGDSLPHAFTVYRRDGQIWTYIGLNAMRLRSRGETDLPTFDEDSRVTPVYVLTRQEDLTGANAITYQYETAYDNQLPGDFSYRIHKITYTAPPSQNVQLAPRRWILFQYDDTRPDPIISYMSGVRTVIRSRLKAIEVYAPNPINTERVWTYKLGYEKSPWTSRSLLTKVFMCDQTDNCSWDKTFAYTAPIGIDEHVAPGDFEFDTASLSRLDNPSSFLSPWYSSTDVRLMLFDADGDGIDDALYRTKYSQFDIVTDFSAKYFTYTPGKIYLRSTTCGSATCLGPLDSRRDLSATLESAKELPSGAQKAHLGKSRVGDLNGDGIADLLLARTVVTITGEVPVSSDPNNPPGVFAVSNWSFGYTLFPALGVTDPTYAGLAGSFGSGESMTGPLLVHEVGVGYHNRLFTPAFQRVLVDLDGDGRLDYVDAFVNESSIVAGDYLNEVDWNNLYQSSIEARPYKAYRASGSGSSTPDHVFEARYGCQNSKMIAADVDGDGRTDILALWDFPMNQLTADSPPNPEFGLYRRLFVDDQHLAKVANTSGLWGGMCKQDAPDLVQGDFNGDGLEDVLYPPHSYQGEAQGFKDNTVPLVRWNLGNGEFGPLEPFPVMESGQPSTQLTDLMYQPVPLDGSTGYPMGWDRGTRAVDLDGDGRTDIVAFRLVPLDCQDNTPFKCVTLTTIVIVYLSAGDHFEAKKIFTWSDGGISLSEGFSTAQVGDVTGDGAVDLVHVVDDLGGDYVGHPVEGKIHTLELPWRSEPDRLLSVYEGWNSGYPLETFTYTRNWWGEGPRPSPVDLAAHAPGGACAYPRTCTRRGFTVVREQKSFVGTQPNGSPMYRRQTHKYADPRGDLTGRGSLGFAAHHIWDVGLGQETIRTFDNATRVDLNGAGDGAVFYPFAGLPKTITAITSLLPLPTQPELDGPSNVPGWSDPEVHWEKARRVQITYDYAVVPAAPGPLSERILSVHPTGFQSVEEEGYTIVLGTVVPSYYEGTTDSWAIPSTIDLERQTHGQYGYDAFDNLAYVKTATVGGVVRETSSEYEHRVNAKYWLPGLQTKEATSSYDSTSPDQGHPIRIVRADYDAQGLVKTIKRHAILSNAFVVIGDEEASEDQSTITDIVARDSHGNVTLSAVTAFDDPVSRTTQVTYDVEGVYPITVTDPAGVKRSSLRHPALGVPVLVLDENNVATYLKYDGFGRLRQGTRTGAAKLERTYSEYLDGPRRGIIVADTSEDGSALTTTYDELGRALKTQQLGFLGESIAASREYNAFGLLSEASRPGYGTPSANAASYTYDRLSRPLSEVDPDLKKTTYQQNRFDTHSIDPEGHETYVIRDHDDRVIESGHIKSNQHYGALHFKYGPFNQVQEVTDAANSVTTTQYDTFGRLTHLEDPDKGSSDFSYNGFGEVLTRTDQEGQVTNQYDVLGRVSHSTGPDGERIFVWDAGPNAAGRLVSSTSPDLVTTQYFYDAFGRNKRIESTVGGETYTFDISYDKFGRVSELYYPKVSGKDRFAAHQRYTSTGYLQAVEGWECPEAFYRPCMPRELWRADTRNRDLGVEDATFGNGLHVSRKNNVTTGRLMEVAVSAVGYGTKYDYYADGNVHTRLDTHSGRKETAYYDALHRLSGWSVEHCAIKPESGAAHVACPDVPDKDTTYIYDELGNLDKVVENPPAVTVFSADYGAQRPHGLDAITVGSVIGQFGYDKRGRQKDAPGRTTTYTDFDLPRGITTAQDTTAFAYDVGGARVRKVVYDNADLNTPVSTTIYVGGLYERRQDASGESHVFYVMGEPGIVVQVMFAGAQESTRYLVSDGVGSTTLVADQSGAVLERGYYDPFGHRTDASGNAINDPDSSTTKGFGGHEDDGTGLVNMGGRIYDRNQYRFLTPDPIIQMPFFGQSRNPYSYVLNNPLTFADPTGYQSADPTVQADDGQQHQKKQSAIQELFTIKMVSCAEAGNPDICTRTTIAPPKRSTPTIGSDQQSGSSSQGDTAADTRHNEWYQAREVSPRQSSFETTWCGGHCRAGQADEGRRWARSLEAIPQVGAMYWGAYATVATAAVAPALIPGLSGKAVAGGIIGGISNVSTQVLRDSGPAPDGSRKDLNLQSVGASVVLGAAGTSLASYMYVGGPFAWNAGKSVASNLALFADSQVIWYLYGHHIAGPVNSWANGTPPQAETNLTLYSQAGNAVRSLGFNIAGAYYPSFGMGSPFQLMTDRVVFSNAQTAAGIVIFSNAGPQ